MATLASRDRAARSIAFGYKLAAAPVVGACAVAVGLGIHKIPRSAMWPLLAAVPALIAIAFVVARGPRACLAMLVATTILGLNVHAVGGQHGFRLIDVFWIALVGWTLRIRSREGPIPGRQVGQRWVGIWLIALLVSLYPVLVRGDAGLLDAFISWARLAETISLVWLVPYALRSIDDIELMLGVVELSLAAKLLLAIAQSGGNFGERLSGASADTTGLLGALLVAASVYAPVPRKRGLRAFLFVLGLTGLLLTRSVGALAAAGVVLGVFGFRSYAARGTSPYRGLLVPARLLLLVLAVLAVGATLRPGSLPTSKTFGQSTTLDRTVIFTAGLEMFRDHPVAGVGWSRGPYEIGSDKIDRQLRSIFGNSLRPDFLPQENGGASSLHNTYVEMLAEAGLIGFGAFLALAIAAAAGVRRVLRSVASDPRIATSAWCATALLIGVLVWWNDNALFGSQPETVMAATLLGILAAVPLIQRRAYAAGTLDQVSG